MAGIDTQKSKRLLSDLGIHAGAPILLTSSEIFPLPGFDVVPLEPGKSGPQLNGRLTWKNTDVYICVNNAAEQRALGAELDKKEAAGIYLCPVSRRDPRDFFQAEGLERFVEVFIGGAAIWTERGPVTVESAEQFIDKQLPDQEEIIGCGILPPESQLVISAYSKMGKSLFAMNMAICLAAGKPFLVQFPIPKPRRVLYMQAEISDRAMQDRARKMLSSARAEGIFSGGNLELVNRPGIKIDSTEGMKTAMRIIRAKNPEVVIWDPLYTLHNQDENKAEKMRRVLDQFDYLRSVFKISQVIVHHHGKPSKDAGDRDGFQLMRGSSVFDAFADSYLTLTRWKKTEPAAYQKLVFTLRNAEAPEDLLLYRNPDNLWYEVVAEAEKESKLSIANVVNTILHFGGKAKRLELAEKLKENYGVGQRTIETTLTAAREAGRIRVIRDGKEAVYATVD